MTFGTVELGDSSRALQICTALTKPQLRWCYIGDSAAKRLASLSALSSLRHLSITPNAKAAGHVLAVAPGMFASLSNMTCLELQDGISITDANMFVPRTMPLLQRLVLQGSYICITAAALTDIHSLTDLRHLSLESADLDISSTSLPSFKQPTALQYFSLKHGSFHAGALAALTQLQQLHLQDTDLTDAAALLAVLQKMQQLQHLCLHKLECAWPPVSAAYGALTASSKLTCLEVYNCNCPQGIWQYAFPEGRQLPALHGVEIWWDNYLGTETTPVTPTAPFSTGDLQHLVSSCPNLEKLLMIVRPDVSLAALSQLSALSDLWILIGLLPLCLVALAGKQRITCKCAHADAVADVRT